MKRKRIDEHTLGVLEFSAVREALAGYAASDLGRGAALQLEPSVDETWIEQRMAETTELRDILQHNVRIPLSGLRDIGPLLDSSGSGVALEPGALLEICDTLRAGGTLKRWLAELVEPMPGPRLKALFGKLEPFDEIVDEITRCIEGDDTVKDTASDKLRGLRSS